MASAPNPPPLVVAASLVAVQGLVLVGLGVAELLSISSERLGVGVPTTVFFLGYGALLLIAALALTRRRSWARGPVLMTQLIQLGLAWELRDFYLVAGTMAASALFVIAGMLAKQSVAAMNADPLGD